MLYFLIFLVLSSSSFAQGVQINWDVLDEMNTPSPTEEKIQTPKETRVKEAPLLKKAALEKKKEPKKENLNEKKAPQKEKELSQKTDVKKAPLLKETPLKETSAVLPKKEEKKEKTLCQSESGCVGVVLFAPDSSVISFDAEKELEKIYRFLLKNPDVNLRLQSYASLIDETGHKARRLSLSRALAMRSYFVEKGIHSTRIELRPLGYKENVSPLDKVEVIKFKR
ncbi:MAG: OmpA family protein [Alphaproteobacteria bacterium]|nr:OmpA family protein [Alphaproteobacteria bacterium]